MVNLITDSILRDLLVDSDTCTDSCVYVYSLQQH